MFETRKCVTLPPCSQTGGVEWASKTNTTEIITSMHGVTHEVAGQLGGGDGHIATKDQVVQAASTGQAKHGKVALQEGIKGEDNPDGKNGDW